MDTYNANPASVREALKTLQELRGAGNAIAILGDMLELGEQAEALHEEIGALLAETGVDRVFLKGTLSRFTAAGAIRKGVSRRSGSSFSTIPRRSSPLSESVLKKDDWILIKGSRKMKMEAVAEAIIAAFDLKTANGVKVRSPQKTPDAPGRDKKCFFIFYIRYMTTYSFFNVFRYITFRTIYAAITALVICFVIGPWLIRKLQELQIGQTIREDGPDSHLAKKGTPTMGGILIIFAVTISTLLWANLTVGYIWLVDHGHGRFRSDRFSRRLPEAHPAEQPGRAGKGPAGRGDRDRAVRQHHPLSSSRGSTPNVTIPFFKTVLPNLGWGYILLSTFIIVGAANAVNLTDGLDGLAIGPAITCFMTYLLFAYFAGNIKIAAYLQIPYVAGTGELAIFCGAVVGAGIGFLWYNTYPAQVFMGDVGSLSLGGSLGTLAVLTKQEILLAIVGGIFVLETFSVIFQVGWFKLSNGKRIFRMAPIHHHFELKGWPEPKVIVRFWIISILLALVAISTLKLR